GGNWQAAKNIVDGSGGPAAIALPDAEARYVRLALADGPGSGYALTEVEIKELAFGATPTKFVMALAREAPRGTYPRGFSGEQPYWTIVGIDGGAQSGLLSEDGALEVRGGGFSIEPFVVAGSRGARGATAACGHLLPDANLPSPVVACKDPRRSLRARRSAEGIGAPRTPSERPEPA